MISSQSHMSWKKFSTLIFLLFVTGCAFPPQQNIPQNTAPQPSSEEMIDVESPESEEFPSISSSPESPSEPTDGPPPTPSFEDEEPTGEVQPVENPLVLTPSETESSLAPDEEITPPAPEAETSDPVIVPPETSPLAGTLEIYSDFECPYCKIFEREVVSVLRQKYPRVAIQMYHFPLPAHEHALLAATFSVCAEKQGKDLEMKSALFAASDLSETNLWTISKNLTLDEQKLSTCLSDPATKALIFSEIESGKKLGVTGTPTFFLNGIKYEGAYPLENVEKLLKEDQK
jgi:protein-disulfide isomerase